MEVKNNIPFNFEESRNRIKKIIDHSGDFTTSSSIPARKQLDLENGSYVDCYAIMTDIRGSSKLTRKKYRPTLAKLYRCYISEVVAALVDSQKCREVSIVGDAVLGIPFCGHS